APPSPTNGEYELLGRIAVGEAGPGEVVGMQKRDVELLAFEVSVAIDIAAAEGLLEERLRHGAIADECLDLVAGQLAVAVAGLGLIDRHEPLVGDAAALQRDVDDAIARDRCRLDVAQQR